MVTSLTALRTRIKQRYGVSASKLTDTSLFAICKPLEDDMHLYACYPHGEGFVFCLPSETPALPRSYPLTFRAFRMRLAREGIPFKESASRRIATATEIFNEQGVSAPHIAAHSSGFGSYKLIYVKGKLSPTLCSKLTYGYLNDDEMLFLFLTDSGTENYTEFLTNLCSALVSCIMNPDIPAELPAGLSLDELKEHMLIYGSLSSYLSTVNLEAV